MAWYGIGGFLFCGLLLMARSASKQGEMLQFVRALGLVTLLIAAVSAFVFGWIWIDQH